MGNIEITMKLSRLKSVNSIDDDYLGTQPLEACLKIL